MLLLIAARVQPLHRRLRRVRGNERAQPHAAGALAEEGRQVRRRAGIRCGGSASAPGGDGVCQKCRLRAATQPVASWTVLAQPRWASIRSCHCSSIAFRFSKMNTPGHASGGGGAASTSWGGGA